MGLSLLQKVYKKKRTEEKIVKVAILFLQENCIVLNSV